jgi:hypothetical protein
MTLPLPGQPGHGKTARLRRQPTRITDGRIEGGYTGVFEPDGSSNACASV